MGICKQYYSQVTWETRKVLVPMTIAVNEIVYETKLVPIQVYVDNALLR